jgi:hypothetical protein
MTQSKPKPVTKRLSQFDRFRALLYKCYDEELKRLAEKIDQLLWERKMVAEAESAPGDSVDGFVFLEALRQRAESRLRNSQS